MNLKQGTKVKYDYQYMKGEGIVVGISNTLPVMGNMYIIQTDSIITEEYPYTTFVCPECYITFWL